MTFEELKAAVQSRIWDIFHQNNFNELDDFSLRLSEKIAKKMISTPIKVNISSITNSTRTNFFKINNVTKKLFSDLLTKDLRDIYELYKPNKRKSKGKHVTVTKTKPRYDFSDDAKIQTFRKQDHRCAICGRILGVVDWDHEDGNRSNNDPSNCRALCPYCHAIVSRRRQSLGKKKTK